MIYEAIWRRQATMILTNYGLVMSYGATDLGQNCHQAIT